MPFYYQIDGSTPAGRRTAAGLIRLRGALDKLPARDVEGTLLLATWNIREFDSRKFGGRLNEAIHYIAEIVSRFDLVAVQEVRQDLGALDGLRDVLGSWWDYVVTDVTEGRQGFGERMAFLFDSRKVRFSGLAGEVVLPPVTKVAGDGKRTLEPGRQLYRTPFLVGFRSGWFHFSLCTVHILYGEGVEDNAERREEVRAVAEFLAERAKEEAKRRSEPVEPGKDLFRPRRRARSNNVILLGDFNIFRPHDVTYEALTGAGFEIPEKLQKVPQTNTGKEARHYDQIAFMCEDDPNIRIRDAGVFNYYKHVFADGDFELYREYMKPDADPAFYRTHWRTYQMSDHLPMWTQIQTDFGDEYLRKKSGGDPGVG
jgi:endonuclease/exonuclease/phosphatase family metal-dependent hydrolase